jgi:hypothetical protein
MASSRSPLSEITPNKASASPSGKQVEDDSALIIEDTVAMLNEVVSLIQKRDGKSLVPM